MEFKDLRKDCRYLFYRKDSNREFRATFIDIINYTLRVKLYEENGSLNNSLMVTMPLGWIKKVVNLSIITNEKILSNDILNEIDLLL
jgi:exoribonuclease II